MCSVSADSGPRHLVFSNDGRFAYLMSELSGKVTVFSYKPTKAHPRQFNITPNGKYLLCCCRDSDKIQVFRRDMQTGMLTDTHRDIAVSKAVCAQFFYRCSG